ncbi:MAG: UDP-glucose 4-epimerase GalE [Kiritimatiellaeota bacterium]|nr:UDP-glucose 4-epimerase GalE [Kiritimatiellota bacterium]
MNLFVTGGAGYIGSHTVLELLNAGHAVTVADNLSNSSEESLRRVQKLTGRPLVFHRLDLLDEAALRAALKPGAFDAVIHFAGLKAVGESVAKPLEYYHNNVGGALTLLRVMRDAGCKTLVFSSSATVYGLPGRGDLDESLPVHTATNPYGQTKCVIERVLADLHAADPSWRIANLRYFNPVGAHKSGEIGEDPSGIPNNLMPFIAQVAVGKLPGLRVFGNDYPTPDGTGVRDYLHVVDLALGHLRAVDVLLAEPPQLLCVNLGTGRGVSVLEMVRAFEKASGKKIPFSVAPRRAGDIAVNYAVPGLAEKRLGWKTSLTLDDMCADTWRWQSKYPNGYR